MHVIVNLEDDCVSLFAVVATAAVTNTEHVSHLN